MFDDLAELANTVTQRFMYCYSNNPRVANFDCDAFCQLAGIGQNYENLSGHLAADVFAHLENDHDTVVYSAHSTDPQSWLDKIVHQVDTLVVIVKEDGEFVGEDGLVKLFEEHASADLPLQEAVKSVAGGAVNLNPKKAPVDDITLLTLSVVDTTV